MALPQGTELDHETTPFYDLQLTASDQASPPRRQIVNLRMVIADVNDNSPVFNPDQYTVSVPEVNITNSVYALEI